MSDRPNNLTGSWWSTGWAGRSCVWIIATVPGVGYRTDTGTDTIAPGRDTTGPGSTHA